MHEMSRDDLEFLREFEAGTFSPANFDHRAHLRLAYVHLAANGLKSALPEFRRTLLAYLAHHNVDAGKYHATITQAWLRAVWHFMTRSGATGSATEFLDRSPVLLDPKVMLTHYSKSVLFSESARQAYVEPDLEPIPGYCGEGG
jgi:hypothetical protein